MRAGVLAESGGRARRQLRRNFELAFGAGKALFDLYGQAGRDSALPIGRARPAVFGQNCFAKAAGLGQKAEHCQPSFFDFDGRERPETTFTSDKGDSLFIARIGVVSYGNARV